MPEPSTSILILSDIHFGTMTEHVDLALTTAPPANAIQGAKPLVESLIETASAVSPKPTYILVPGDLTSTGTPDEFKGCVSVIERIGGAMGVAPDKIIYTFGNHDTDWRISDLGESYYDKAGRSGADFAKNGSVFLPGPLPGCGQAVWDDLEIFVVNSGYSCVKQRMPSFGSLGTDQLKWLEGALEGSQQGTPLRILMLHHHAFNYKFPVPVRDISNLEEGAELRRIAGQFGVDIVVHGHRHHPISVTTSDTGWHHPVTYICAGSVGVDCIHRSNGHIPNLFHVLTKTGRSEQGAAVGILRTFGYTISKGWIPWTYSEEVPLDHEHHFGSHAGVAECKTKAESLIEEARTQSAGLLPEFGELPLELRCMPKCQLQRLLSDAVAATNGRITGTYENGFGVQLNW